MSNSKYSSLSFVLLLFILVSQQSYGQFFLTSDEIPECSDCESSYPCGIESPEINNGVKYRFSYVPLIGYDYNRDGFSDQWLDIYIPNSPPPPEGFPVVVYAHAASQTAEDACESADAANSMGIVFISWESVNDDSRTSNNQFPSVEMSYKFGDGDFNRVLRWVRDQASVVTNTPLNLDHVIVAGSSRGARLSFSNMADVLNPETGQPLIKAAIFSQAFPDLEWNYAQNYGIPAADELVQSDYPPILFTYEKNPGIIDDIHDPIHGIKVMEELQCQGVPSALIYNLNYPLFSQMSIEYLLDFFFDPIGSIEDIEGEVIAVNNSVAPLTLKAPKNLALQGRPDSPRRFLIKWNQNEWAQVEPNPVRLDCELRGVSQNADDFCQAYTIQRNFINDFSNNTATPDQFRIPNDNSWNACNLPSYMQAGSTYVVQARCFIKVQGYGILSTFTPWSEFVEITIPDCNEVTSVFKTNSSFVESTGPARWRIVNSGSEIHEYEVYDLQGRRVLYNRGYESDLDLSPFPEGIYLLNVKTGNEVFRTKLSTSSF